MNDETTIRFVEDAVCKEFGVRPGTIVAYEGKTFKVSGFDVNLKAGTICVRGCERLDGGYFALNDVAIARISDVLKESMQ